MVFISLLRSLSLNSALLVLFTLMVFRHGTLLAPQLPQPRPPAGGRLVPRCPCVVTPSLMANVLTDSEQLSELG